MPSLNALEQFKDSFNNIAGEKKDFEDKKLPFNDLTLPDTEAPPFEVSDGEPASGSDGFDFSAFLNTLPADHTAPPSVDDILGDAGGAAAPADDGLPSMDDIFDTGGTAAPADDGLPSTDDLLGDAGGATAPTDDGLPSMDDLLGDAGDTSSATAPSDDGIPAAAPPEDEDPFSVPDELLSGLSEEIESAPKDKGVFDIEDVQEDEQAEPENGVDDDALDLGGERRDGTFSTEKSDAGSPVPSKEPAPDDAALPEDLTLDETPPPQDAPSEDFDLPQDSGDAKGADDSSLDDIMSGDGSIDLGGESPDTAAGGSGEDSFFDNAAPDSGLSGMEPDQGGADLSGADAAMPDIDASLGDMGFPEPSADSDSQLPDMDFTADSAGGDSGFAPSANYDDLGSEFASDSIELESSVPIVDDTVSEFTGDDFDLPLDDILEKTKVDDTPKAKPKKGLFAKKKAKEEEEQELDDDNVEEIQLTQGQLDSLLQTLSVYPLNLRVACEELIAEHVILPQQLSKLIRLLVKGAPAKDTAEFAGQILGKTIAIPKSFEKSTGAAWEEEKTSFAYIFVHNFLPVLRLFAVIAALTACVVYLSYKFVYIPYKAESLYKRGYERIPAGEYQRANELFHEAFITHRKKKWFYSYAESFRDQRRYMLAENKYDELLRYYPRDKKGALDYANLETNYLLNYDKADKILQQQLLDYAPDDFDGLLASGDNFLAWGDSNPSVFYDKYDDARFAYARLLEKYGWTPPVVERMLKYFIRTDNLKEVLPLRAWFDNDIKNRLSPEATAELGGYLLDKQLEKPDGVPNAYIESIESVRAMLLQAVKEDPNLPEPHYHLARYHKNLGNTYDERLTLENAIRAFDLAKSESVRRRIYRVDAHYRYADLLVNNREFFAAEEQIVRGINLYEDFLNRNLIAPSAQLGKLYAAKGDLEYFVKTGNMEEALRNYKTSEKYGWSPPEIQYRMGAAYYQLEDWRNALDYFFKASADLPLNRRLLYALGNTTYRRGDYFAAQGYYNRLLDILENQRLRMPVLLPNDRPEFLELGERLMMARNNAGAVYEALADVTGNRDYRSRALSLYSESARAWDSITRNPESMARMRITDSPGAPGVNLGFLNANNALYPSRNYKPEIFPRVDKDAVEPSRWEELAPFGGLIN